jgi:hypothetical protein
MLTPEIVTQIREALASATTEVRTYPLDPRYFVTDCGNVFTVWNGVIHKKSIKGYSRYPRIILGPKRYSLHSVVCTTFHGPKPFPKAIIRHLDSNPNNAAASNLRWGTSAENNLDTTLKFKAERGHGWKGQLVPEQVKIIRELAELGVSKRKLSILLDVNDSTIRRIVKKQHYPWV